VASAGNPNRALARAISSSTKSIRRAGTSLVRGFWATPIVLHTFHFAIPISNATYKCPEFDVQFVWCAADIVTFLKKRS
jgi:hypothetical protein